MKTTIQWKRFASFALFLSLTWVLCFQAADTGWTQDKTGEATSVNPQAENFLDLRGDVPNPQRVDPVPMNNGLPAFLDLVVAKGSLDQSVLAEGA